MATCKWEPPCKQPHQSTITLKYQGFNLYRLCNIKFKAVFFSAVSFLQLCFFKWIDWAENLSYRHENWHPDSLIVFLENSGRHFGILLTLILKILLETVGSIAKRMEQKLITKLYFNFIIIFLETDLN